MEKNKTIVISSGKGGTGKTFIATNLARVLELSGKDVRYLDCDVEEPNGHLFLHPEIVSEKDATVFSPVGIDNEKCTGCGKCEDNCNYNAIAVINKKALFFQDLCHICGACTLVCPANAIIESDRVIGTILQGKSNAIDFHYALLKTGEGGMSPRLIKEVKKHIGEGINIVDSPPGTSCPVVETVKGSDLCVLVTDPTPFGLHDLKLSVDMCRETGIEPVVLINRSGERFEELNTYCFEEELEIIGEVPDDREVAEYYSIGKLAVEKMPQFLKIFQDIADKIIERSLETRLPKKRKIQKHEQIIENLIKVGSKNEVCQRIK
jgi:MinD superfamily P-loop ATPase